MNAITSLLTKLRAKLAVRGIKMIESVVAEFEVLTEKLEKGLAAAKAAELHELEILAAERQRYEVRKAAGEAKISNYQMEQARAERLKAKLNEFIA